MIKYAGFETRISPSTFLLPRVACRGQGGTGVETEGKKSLNRSIHQRLSPWDFRGKQARIEGDAIPEMRFRCRVHAGEKDHGLPPRCPGEGPKGALAAMVALARCSNPALGHLLKAVQSIRWHIREQFQPRGCFWQQRSLRVQGCQAPKLTFTLSQGNFLNFFFLTTAIFMLGIVCRFGWKDTDHHFIKFPGSESLSLFVFA